MDLLHNLCAYTCAATFGPHNPKKHKKGFLANIINQYVPQQLLDNFSTSEVEKMIILDWKFLSMNKYISSDNKQAVRNYVGTCEEFLDIFGCFPFRGTMLTNGKKERRVILGLRQAGIFVVDSDNGLELLCARYV